MLKKILFSIFLLCYQSAHLQTNTTYPNFILILADDQGWNGTSVKMIDNNDLSRSDFYETPNIERIAEKGVVFSNAYASAPVCAGEVAMECERGGREEHHRNRACRAATPREYGMRGWPR